MTLMNALPQRNVAGQRRISLCRIRSGERTSTVMKTLAKVLETMLSKPATPTWTTDGPALRPQVGPTQGWGWGP